MINVKSKFYNEKPKNPAENVRSGVSSPQYKQSFGKKRVDINEIKTVAKDVFEKAFKSDVHKLNFGPNDINLGNGVFDGRMSEVIDSAKKIAKDVKTDVKFNIKGEEITFTDLPIAVKLLKKVVYPIYPGLLKDAPNAAIDALQKTKVFKDAAWLDTVKSSKFLSERREQVKAEKIISSLHGVTDKIAKANKDGGASVLEDFYVKLSGGSHGSYSTQSERALNALATSTVSGIFSARDFYNISRFHDDDHEKAKKSEKERFKYDATRGIIKALASFATMGALSRFTNSNGNAAVVNLMTTTLFIEVISRLISGKALGPISKEKAIEKYNELHKDKPEVNVAKEEEKPKETEIAKTELGASEEQEGANPVKIVFGAIAGLFALGLGKGILTKYSKPAAKFFGKISDTIAENMDKLKIREVKIAKTDVEKALKGLQAADKNKFAEILSKATESNLAQGGATYILKSSDTPLGKVSNVLSGLGAIVVKPFSTGEKWSDRVLKKVDPKALKKFTPMTSYKSPQDQKAVVEIIHKINKKIAKLEKNGENVSEGLKKYVNGMVDNGFDINTSMLDNRKLIKKFVFFNTLIPSFFSVMDYRNEELIQSKGEVTPRVKEVTNQRILHRIVNYFSNRVFIDAYMGLFGPAFNSSLLAATGITALTELTNESTIRFLTRTPIRKMNKEQLEDYYSKEDKASGVIRKIMGKKSIKEKAGIKK